jgi:hypothetical protein
MATRRVVRVGPFEALQVQFHRNLKTGDILVSDNEM